MTSGELARRLFLGLHASVVLWEHGSECMYSTIRQERIPIRDSGDFCSAGDSYTDSIFGNLEVMKYTITNGKSYGIFFRKDSLVIRRLQWYDKSNM